MVYMVVCGFNVSAGWMIFMPLPRHPSNKKTPNLTGGYNASRQVRRSSITNEVFSFKRLARGKKGAVILCCTVLCYVVLCCTVS